MTQITMTKNEENKIVPVGFSGSTLVFGFFPALLRGDIKWSIIMFISALFTYGISWLAFPFIYNKIYIKALLAEGYGPLTKDDVDLMKIHGFYEKDSFDMAVDALAKTDTDNPISKVNNPEELEKWDDLLKSEIITEKEFQTKKKELLNFSNDGTQKETLVKKNEKTNCNVENLIIKNKKLNTKKKIYLGLIILAVIGMLASEENSENNNTILPTYKVVEYSEGTYRITSDMSRDKIEVINLIPNPMTQIQAQRVKNLTNGKIRTVGNGYEIFNTKNGYANKFFIINNKKQIEYFIKDGKLKEIYDNLKYNKGKRLENYTF